MCPKQVHFRGPVGAEGSGASASGGSRQCSQHAPAVVVRQHRFDEARWPGLKRDAPRDSELGAQLLNASRCAVERRVTA